MWRKSPQPCNRSKPPEPNSNPCSSLCLFSLVIGRRFLWVSRERPQEQNQLPALLFRIALLETRHRPVPFAQLVKKLAVTLGIHPLPIGKVGRRRIVHSGPIPVALARLTVALGALIRIKLPPALKIFRRWLERIRNPFRLFRHNPWTGVKEGVHR